MKTNFAIFALFAVALSSCSSIPKEFFERKVEVDLYGVYMFHPSYGIFGMGTARYRREPGVEGLNVEGLKAIGNPKSEWDEVDGLLCWRDKAGAIDCKEITHLGK